MRIICLWKLKAISPRAMITHLSTDTYIHMLNNNSSWKMHYFTFFPFKSPRDHICRKIGQGQPKVIIWTSLVVFSHLILFQISCSQPSGTGEKDLISLIPYRDVAASWSCDLDWYFKLLFPRGIDVPHKIWLQSVQGFLRRWLKWWADNGPLVYYKLTLWACGSGELNKMLRIGAGSPKMRMYHIDMTYVTNINSDQPSHRSVWSVSKLVSNIMHGP